MRSFASLYACKDGGRSRCLSSLNTSLFVSFFLSPGHNQHPGFTVSAFTVVRRFLPRHLLVKLPISNWSKHGQTTIILPDKQYVSRADIVLLCGDIHPQPGPCGTSIRTKDGTATQAGKISLSQASKNRKHNLTVAHLNARSMASRENFYLVEQMVINYDVFTISETWLDPSICDSDIHIPGYYVI